VYDLELDDGTRVIANQSTELIEACISNDTDAERWQRLSDSDSYEDPRRSCEIPHMPIQRGGGA